MIDDSDVTEFSFRVDRSEYLGSERIVYGSIEGIDAAQVITAKLPARHMLPKTASGPANGIDLQCATARFAISTGMAGGHSPLKRVFADGHHR